MKITKVRDDFIKDLKWVPLNSKCIYLNNLGCKPTFNSK